MASIFTRFSDIVSSNINAMLDKAENPEKMIKLIIGEMEDTLIELKISCSQAMADASQRKRLLHELEASTELWGQRANLAVNKNRDDLAREALIEKKEFSVRKDLIKSEVEQLSEIIDKYKNEIKQLEEKLQGAKEKEYILNQQEKKATSTIKYHHQLNKYDQADKARFKFETLENKIERLEAEANLSEWSFIKTTENRQTRLEEEFLALDDSIEEELFELKKNMNK